MNKSLLAVIGIMVFVRVATFKYDYPENVAVRISGRVVEDPVVYDASRQVVVNGLRAYVDLYPEVVYGDKVILDGVIEEGVLKDAVLVEAKRGGGLYGIRERIILLYKEAIPEPHSSLVAGIVLGSKADMPEEFWEQLKFTGTAHVVVASGMNVTFIISFLLNLFVHFIKRPKAIAFAILGSWVYVVLSGFDAPLVRAAIMGSIAFGAQGLGRISTATRALILSAGIMLIIKPEWFYDLGFILSFTATMSLIIFEPKVSRMLQKIPLIRSVLPLKKDLATTIAAQIGVTPILLFSFGTVNIFSPLINALVLWTIPPIMIFGAIAGLCGLAIPFVGELIVLLSLPFSYWFVGVINLLS